MTTITDAIDGDTFKQEDEFGGDAKSIRLANVNTPESVHSDDSKNTEAGEQASEFQKAFTSSGSMKKTHDYGVDHYGREVSTVAKTINGVDIDAGLVIMDQGYSSYQTRFGEAKDPAMHENYKEFFSKDMPYQYGEFRQPMTREAYAEIADAQVAFSETYNKLQNGETTQEEFDQATYNLYKDPQKVAHFRYMQAGWGKETTETNVTNSNKDSIAFALQNNPRMIETYNMAVKNAGLGHVRYPEKEKGFWEKFGGTVSQMGSIANYDKSQELQAARMNKQTYDVPVEQLIKDVPEKYKAKVHEEADKYGTAAGLELRDQIVEDVANEKQFDDMAWYAQIGYGGLTMLTDPLSWVAGAPIAKGVQATNKGIQMYQLGNAIQGTRMWTQGRVFENTAKGITWATAGVAETGVTALPQLAGDHTYTSRDYYMDLAMGGIFGTVLGGGVELGKFGIETSKANRAAIRELEAHIENPNAPRHNSDEQEASDIVNAGNSQETVNSWVNLHQNKPKTDNNEKFTPWAAISEVSTEGYQGAARAIRDTFPKGSQMHVLLNKQIGLNQKGLLTDETSLVAREINSEILHLASMYPDGKVPQSVSDAIKGVAYTQKDSVQINVVDSILQGKTTEQTELMTKYVNDLMNDYEPDNVPLPQSSGRFASTYGDMISMENKIDKDDLFTLTQALPKEVSFLKDMLELNVHAKKVNDPEFTKLVEQLNGLLAAKLDELEFKSERAILGEGLDESPVIQQRSNQSFGKNVKMSPDEIIARMKKEGLTKGTPEWKARFKQLRQGSVAVSKEVQEVGPLGKQVVGRNFTKQETDAPESAFINDARAELTELKKSTAIMDEADLAKIKNKDDRYAAKQESDAIEKQIESLEDMINKQFNEKSSELEFEADTSDIMRRTITKITSNNAYKEPTVENLTKLRNKLRAINKKNGSTVIPRKKDAASKRKRLQGIKARMKTNKGATIRGVLKNGSIGDIVDVIRVAHTLANKARQEVKTPTTPKSPDAVDTGPDMTKPITEEEIDVLVNTPEELTPEQRVDLEAKAEQTMDAVIEGASTKIADGLDEWKRSGGEKLLVLSAKPNGAVDFIGRMLTKLTKSVGEIFVDSKLTSMRYFGATVTEIGRGFGGKAKRAFSAAVIKDAEFKASIVKAIPQYRHSIDAYATSKGKGALGKLKARERSGQSDPLVQQFNEELFLVQEYRRQGKPIPKSIHKSVTDFADQWDIYMDHNHKALVDSNAAGFKADRKVKHYIPHIWQSGKVKGAITKHGQTKVRNTLAKAYQNLDGDLSLEQAQKQADDLLENILDDAYIATDQYSPVMDARAKTRRDLDTTTEIDGVRILDLLDTDVVGLATKYSHRVGGWTGLAKATKGMITSQMDIDVFKANIIEEALEKGVKPDRFVQMFEDTIDQLFGRPTKNMFFDSKGLPQELRELKDLAALTKMGGLGTSQLIETGTVMTRNTFTMFSDPKTAQKVLNMGREGKSDRLLIEEIQSISNITNDLEFLDRQQVHLDQTQLEESGVLRKMSLKIASLATGGELKAEASRGLGKLSGYNMTRRFQTRVTQASFILDIANHFTRGKGVMGNARMADVGITDTLGKNVGLEAAFKKHAEFDENGVLVKLNIDKWDKSIREELQYAMIRDEAQQIQRTHVGELPPWMNKPLMGLIFQFRQMPIVANSKALGRAMAFADKEAVTGVMLNTAVAGLVRYGKFVGLAAATGAVVGELDNDKEITDDQTQISRYIAAAGIFPDLHDLVMGRSGISSIDTDSGAGFRDTTWDFIQGQIPVMGLMNDYYNAGEAGAKGDIKGLVESAEGLVPLSNLAIAEVLFAALQPTIDKLPSEIMRNTLHGVRAVNKVTELEGPLNSMEKRIVELEGYEEADYDDDVGVSTSGVGQTGEFKGKSFKETVEIMEERAKKTFKNYDDYSDELQTELVQLQYRGDVKPTFKWVKSINKGNFKAASEELLDHDEYRRRLKKGGDGVTKRLEEASQVFANV